MAFSVGKVIQVPQAGYQWGTVQDEYGNNWHLKSEDMPKKYNEGDSFAYRLDFSQPKNAPLIVEDPD